MFNLRRQAWQSSCLLAGSGGVAERAISNDVLGSFIGGVGRLLVNGGFRASDAVDDERGQIAGSSMWQTGDNERTQTALGAGRVVHDGGSVLPVRLREQIKLGGDRVHLATSFPLRAASARATSCRLNLITRPWLTTAGINPL